MSLRQEFRTTSPQHAFRAHFGSIWEILSGAERLKREKERCFFVLLPRFASAGVEFSGAKFGCLGRGSEYLGRGLSTWAQGLSWWIFVGVILASIIQMSFAQTAAVGEHWCSKRQNRRKPRSNFKEHVRTLSVQWQH